MLAFGEGYVYIHFWGGYTRQHLDGNHYPSVIQVKLLFATLLFMFVYFRYALIGPNIKYWENVQVISKASQTILKLAKRIKVLAVYLIEFCLLIQLASKTIYRQTVCFNRQFSILTDWRTNRRAMIWYHRKMSWLFHKNI